VTWAGLAAWVGRRYWQWTGNDTHFQASVAIGVLGVLAHLSVHHFFDNLFVQGIYLQLALWLAFIESS
jgi:hypothetical protein